MRSSRAAALLCLLLLLLLCLGCLALLLWSALYFTRFTWKSSTDVHPCEMSYFHLAHSSVHVLSSTSPDSPTHDQQLYHSHVADEQRQRHSRYEQTEHQRPVEEEHEDVLYGSDALISNHSIADSVDAAHAAGSHAVTRDRISPACRRNHSSLLLTWCNCPPCVAACVVQVSSVSLLR